MNARNQRTLKNAIRCVGTGLRHGQRAEVVLKPAGPDHGIVFRRTTTSDNLEIPAIWKNASADENATSLGHNGRAAVQGIEQLLSAVAGAGLDNLEVEIDGPEVPILDGSAEPYVFLLSCAGLAEQNAPRRSLKILETVEVGNKERFARLEPYDGFALDVEIEDEHPLIGRQRWRGDLTVERYQEEIARARLVKRVPAHEGHDREVPTGGSLKETSVLLDESHVLNAAGLRYPDEPVRHKVLEVVGDLRMAGAPIIGRFKGKSVDHELILDLLRELFAARKSWEWIGTSKTTGTKKGQRRKSG